MWSKGFQIIISKECESVSVGCRKIWVEIKLNKCKKKGWFWWTRFIWMEEKFKKSESVILEDHQKFPLVLHWLLMNPCSSHSDLDSLWEQTRWHSAAEFGHDTPGSCRQGPPCPSLLSTTVWCSALSFLSPASPAWVIQAPSCAVTLCLRASLCLQLHAECSSNTWRIG